MIHGAAPEVVWGGAAHPSRATSRLTPKFMDGLIMVIPQNVSGVPPNHKPTG